MTLLVGLRVLFALFNKLMFMHKIRLTPMQSLIDYAYLLLILVISAILTTGFQRTVYLKGDMRHPPMALLRTGWHFFGRMVKLGLLWALIYCILVWLTFLIIKQCTPIEAGFSETAKVAPFFYQFYFIVPALILIKPLLLIPAQIIVLECRVWGSFKQLKKCRLFDAKELLILFLISLILSCSWIILPISNEITTISQMALKIPFTILTGFIGLMVAVMAVRFIASLDLVYNENLSPSAPEEFGEE